MLLSLLFNNFNIYIVPACSKRPAIYNSLIQNFSGSQAASTKSVMPRPRIKIFSNNVSPNSLLKKRGKFPPDHQTKMNETTW
jgi:hypothetical protein